MLVAGAPGADSGRHAPPSRRPPRPPPERGPLGTVEAHLRPDTPACPHPPQAADLTPGRLAPHGSAEPAWTGLGAEGHVADLNRRPEAWSTVVDIPEKYGDPIDFPPVIQFTASY